MFAYTPIILWSVLLLVQLAAADAGVAHALHIHPLLAIPISGVLVAFAGPWAAVAGVYGAVFQWHWHWFFAISLFFSPIVMGLLHLAQ